MHLCDLVMFPRRTALALLAAALLAGCAHQPSRAPALPDGTRATVAILETTDIHSNILGYDYYKQKADPTLGFERTATLIGEARKQYPNHFLFDSGDTIQGTVLADWQAQVQKLACDQELAIYRAMDAVGYDGGTAGNHEFNYGLGWLSQIKGQCFNLQRDKDKAGQRCPASASTFSKKSFVDG